MKRGDAGAIPRELEPIGRIDACDARDSCGVSSGCRALLEGRAIGGGHEGDGVFGIGVERFADHHAGLRPAVGVLHALHLGDDGTVSSEGFVNVVELVVVVPDVRSRSLHNMIGRGLGVGTHRSHRADVLGLPGGGGGN